MKRKLMALNLALITLLCALGYRFRQVNLALNEREARVLGKKVAPRTFPPLTPIAPVIPLVAANYLDVAQKMLLSRDRNPTVIIDPEPEKVKPVMPPLPLVQGLMTLGEPSIIMSEKPGATQKTYHQGEKVGAFKLVAFDSETVVLDWNGEMVERKLEDMIERAPAPSATGGAGAGAPAGAPPPPPAPTEAKGPGGDIGGGYHGCLANDSTPSGTVRDGLRKIEVSTPMGKSCRWEPVR